MSPQVLEGVTSRTTLARKPTAIAGVASTLLAAGAVESIHRWLFQFPDRALLCLVPAVWTACTAGPRAGWACTAAAISYALLSLPLPQGLFFAAIAACITAIASSLRRVSLVHVEEAAANRAVDLLQGLDAVVWEADRDTLVFSFLSQRATDIFGDAAKGWIPERAAWGVHLHPDDREWATALAHQDAAAGQDFTIEYRARSAEGRVIWLRDSVRGWASSGSRNIRGVMVDITEWKRSQEALQEKETRLELLNSIATDFTGGMAVEEVLARAVRNIGGPFASVHVWFGSVDPAGRLTVQHSLQPQDSPTFQGRTADLPLSQPPWDELARHQTILINDIVTDSRARSLQCFAVLGGRAFIASPVTTLERLTGILAFTSAEPRDWTDHEIRTLSEISELLSTILRQAHSDELLRHSEEQLRHSQKMEAIGRLAGGVAHDFNNLLTVVLSYSELMLETQELEGKTRKNIEEIRKAAERAAALTRQLLAFGRRQVLEAAVLDLNAVVVDMQSMLPRLIGEDIKFETKLAPELGRVRADRSQIETVLMNLVVNARDAMPGGGRLSIQTTNMRVTPENASFFPGIPVGDWVACSVADTGTGMDTTTRSRLFEPFFTTKARGKGTGLGLSTAYGIMQQSGGNIQVRSAPGQGSTFQILLPRVEDAATQAPAVPAAQGSPRGSETVLLVEDEEAVRGLTKSILEMKGYRVLEARDGEDAMRVAGAHDGTIQILVTDVVMPGMSGRDVARKLEGVRPDTRVLYVSGYTDNAIIKEGVLEPGAAFLQKPFTPHALAQKVRDVLDAVGKGSS